MNIYPATSQVCIAMNLVAFVTSHGQVDAGAMSWSGVGLSPWLLDSSWEEFAAGLESRGVGSDRPAILYDSGDRGLAQSPDLILLWLSLKLLDHPDPRILTGGYAAWESGASRPIELHEGCPLKVFAELKTLGPTRIHSDSELPAGSSLLDATVLAPKLLDPATGWLLSAEQLDRVLGPKVGAPGPCRAGSPSLGGHRQDKQLAPLAVLG